jgi:hypothetical protein
MKTIPFAAKLWRKTLFGEPERCGSSLPSQHAWWDVIAAAQVFESVKPCLLCSDPALQDFNSRFRGNGDVAFIKIYAARHFSKTSRILKGLLVLAELSRPAFKFRV